MKNINIMFEELKNIGLTENEINIYLTMLKLGTSRPSDIAEKTGFSRSYVYDALERLIEKEIVSPIFKNNKKHYTPTNPKRLEELVRQRLEKIKKMLPELEKLQKISKEEIKVELHQGKYVYKTLIKDILSTLKENKEVLIFGIDDEVLMKLDKYYLTYLKQYFSRLQKLNIKERVIVKTNAKILKEAKTTTYRFLPKGVIGNTAFEVYGNKVAIFLWGIPNHLILIENKKVADSYRKQFQILWHQSKK
jgi:sugar-specific transcriptional regulator TrmB